MIIHGDSVFFFFWLILLVIDVSGYEHLLSLGYNPFILYSYIHNTFTNSCNILYCN